MAPGRPIPYGVSEAALSGNTLVTCYQATVFALNATTRALVWESTPGTT